MNEKGTAVSQLTLCICVLDNEIFAYQSNDWQKWSNIKIKGEQGYSHQNKMDNFNVALNEYDQSLNQDNHLQDVHLYVIYTQKNTEFALALLKSAKDKYKNEVFSCRPLEHIYQYYSEQNSGASVPKLDTLNSQWIENNLLLLLSFDSSWKTAQKRLAEIKQKEQALINEQKLKANQFAQTQAEQEQQKQRLDKEINDKKQALAVVTTPSLESLLSYLPSIFKDFWATVRPDELANITGLLTPPQIPSPIQNPSIQAVQSKKRQFLLLNEDEKNQIIGFCILLKQDFDLKIHLEFQPLIGELD